MQTAQNCSLSTIKKVYTESFKEIQFCPRCCFAGRSNFPTFPKLTPDYFCILHQMTLIKLALFFQLSEHPSPYVVPFDTVTIIQHLLVQHAHFVSIPHSHKQILRPGRISRRILFLSLKWQPDSPEPNNHLRRVARKPASSDVTDPQMCGIARGRYIPLES